MSVLRDRREEKTSASSFLGKIIDKMDIGFVIGAGTGLIGGGLEHLGEAVFVVGVGVFFRDSRLWKFQLVEPFALGFAL